MLFALAFANVEEYLNLYLIGSESHGMEDMSSRTPLTLQTE